MYVMQALLGGSGWTVAALQSGVRTWASSMRLEILSATPEAQTDLVLHTEADAPRTAWLVPSSREAATLEVLTALGQHLAIEARRSIRLYAVGAEDGSGQHTRLGYRARLIREDGSLREQQVAAAASLVQARSPVPDDCPHEDFDALLAVLCPRSEAAEAEEVETLVLRESLLDADPRIHRAARAALLAGAHRLEALADGRLCLTVQGLGLRESTFFSAADGARIRAILSGG